MPGDSQISPTMLIVLVAISSMTGGGIGSGFTENKPRSDQHEDIKVEIRELKKSIGQCSSDIRYLDRLYLESKENFLLNH